MSMRDLFPIAAHCVHCNKLFERFRKNTIYCGIGCANKEFRKKEKAKIREAERIIAEYNAKQTEAA